MNDTWILTNGRKNENHTVVWDLLHNGVTHTAGKLYTVCFETVLAEGDDADTYHEDYSDGKRSNTQTVAELRAEVARQNA